MVKKLLIMFVLVAFISCIVYIVAVYQTVTTYNKCNDKTGYLERVSKEKSAEKMRSISMELIDCMEESIAIPGSLFYDREQSIKDISVNLKRDKDT